MALLPRDVTDYQFYIRARPHPRIYILKIALLVETAKHVSQPKRIQAS